MCCHAPLTPPPPPLLAPRYDYASTNFAVPLRAQREDTPDIPRELCDTWAWVKWDCSGRPQRGSVRAGRRGGRAAPGAAPLLPAWQPRAGAHLARARPPPPTTPPPEPSRQGVRRGGGGDGGAAARGAAAGGAAAGGARRADVRQLQDRGGGGGGGGGGAPGGLPAALPLLLLPPAAACRWAGLAPRQPAAPATNPRPPPARARRR